MNGVCLNWHYKIANDLMGKSTFLNIVENEYFKIC